MRWRVGDSEVKPGGGVLLTKIFVKGLGGVCLCPSLREQNNPCQTSWIQTDSKFCNNPQFFLSFSKRRVREVALESPCKRLPSTSRPCCHFSGATTEHHDAPLDQSQQRANGEEVLMHEQDRLSWRGSSGSTLWLESVVMGCEADSLLKPILVQYKPWALTEPTQ